MGMHRGPSQEKCPAWSELGRAWSVRCPAREHELVRREQRSQTVCLELSSSLVVLIGRGFCER